MTARTAALLLALSFGGSAAGTPFTGRHESSKASVGAVAGPDSLLERADAARTLGNASTTLWLIEAGDFECPVCRTWHERSFPTIEREYIRTGRIRFAFVNYPVAQHRYAVIAASAAMCAAAQNEFWPMHDSLYARQATWASAKDPTTVFKNIARAIKLDMTAWSQCVARDSTAPLIQADHDRLRSAGVHGTPSFFIGDRGLPGDPGLPALRAIIDSVLAGRGR
jgi:protein-disulfide isomerase